MRNLCELDAFRLRDAKVLEAWGWTGDETCGAFLVPHGGREFLCIASANAGWDHVSVSLDKRCPSWTEMEAIKRRFFRDDEVAMQLHMPPADHINHHPFCLHIWRPHGVAIPLPPKEFVA